MKPNKEELSLAKVLILDDDEDMLHLLAHLFFQRRLEVTACSEKDQVVSSLARSHYDLVLLDLFIGDDTSLSILPTIRQLFPHTKVAIMSALGTIDHAVEAMQLGAITFLKKGNDPQNLVEATIRLLDQSKLEKSFENIFIETGIIGVSSKIRDLMTKVEKLKNINATVLITGESGTGKELFARSLHLYSKRSHNRFEAINCGAIPETMLESELFGYKSGAFTDAKNDKMGMFEVCDQGTLFLDEIGDLPISLQVKLLRVLQEKEVRKLGSTVSQKIDTRVVCATNKNLLTEIQEKRFREDLYYRLNIFSIDIPSLRERQEDIPHLTKYFIDKFNTQYELHRNYPSQTVMDRLCEYYWPGNIRELQNSIERAVVMSESNNLNYKDFIANENFTGLNVKTESSDNFEDYQHAKEVFEKRYIEVLLDKSKGNISEAARLSGKFRSDIYRLITKYGFDPDNFK